MPFINPIPIIGAQADTPPPETVFDPDDVWVPPVDGRVQREGNGWSYDLPAPGSKYFYFVPDWEFDTDKYYVVSADVEFRGAPGSSTNIRLDASVWLYSGLPSVPLDEVYSTSDWWTLNGQRLLWNEDNSSLSMAFGPHAHQHWRAVANSETRVIIELNLPEETDPLVSNLRVRQATDAEKKEHLSTNYPTLLMTKNFFQTENDSYDWDNLEAAADTDITGWASYWGESQNVVLHVPGIYHCNLFLNTPSNAITSWRVTMPGSAGMHSQTASYAFGTNSMGWPWTAADEFFIKSTSTFVNLRVDTDSPGGNFSVAALRLTCVKPFVDPYHS